MARRPVKRSLKGNNGDPDLGSGERHRASHRSREEEDLDIEEWGDGEVGDDGGEVGDDEEGDEELESRIEKEAEEFKEGTIKRSGAFTPSTVQRKKKPVAKKTWKPLGTGALLIAMGIIGMITSSNLILTAISDPLYSPEAGSLKGYILDEDGDPISGALVYIEDVDHGTFSDEDGSYTLEEVPKGDLVLAAVHPGYQAVRFPTLVLGGTQVQAIGNTNLTLPDETAMVQDRTTGNGSVMGRVLDNNDNPEVNATVEDVATGRSVTTDADGSFLLGEFEAGEREMVVHKANFRDRRITYMVSPGTRDLNVRLTPGNGTDSVDLTEGTYTISGQVTDYADEAVPGALLEVNGTVHEADDRGNFEIEAEGGMVTISVKAIGTSTTDLILLLDRPLEDQMIVLEHGISKELDGDREALRSNLTSCGTVMTVMSLFILITGFFSVKRKRYWIAVAGALLGSLFMLVTFQYGIILGIVAFVLLLLSRREFE